MSISYYFTSRNGGKLPAEDIPQVRFGLPGAVSLAAEPSLSQTAMRRAAELHGKFRTAIDAGRDVLFVAPEPCGFDTLCAMYLVRRALEGRPLRDRIAMLAAYATSERLGQPVSCPLPERLSSIALAARRRGRPLEADGLSRLFEDAVRRMDERGLNPAIDGVLTGVEEWRPELDLLRRDSDEYLRDRARAGRELALWDSNDAPRVEEALVMVEPRSVLAARWAWDDAAGSIEGRGFPVVLLRNGTRMGVAVAPGMGLPQALERLAHLLEETDAGGRWQLIGRNGADGEFGEVGLWSEGGSRLDSTALRELLRSQWVEAVVNGPVRIADFPAEPGRLGSNEVEVSTGRLLAERAMGETGGVRDGYYRVVRVPLQASMRQAMTGALRQHLGELLWPLLDSGDGRLDPARLERTETGMAVCGRGAVAVACTSAGDAAAHQLQDTIASMAALASDAARLSAEPKVAEREQLLQRYVGLRVAAPGAYFRTLQRFTGETRQEAAFDAQRRLWESQALMRETGALRAGLRKVDQLQAKVDYLGMFVIAACVILVAEYVVRPLLDVPQGTMWVAVLAAAVFLAGGFGLIRRRSAGRVQ